MRELGWLDRKKHKNILRDEWLSDEGRNSFLIIVKDRAEFEDIPKWYQSEIILEPEGESILCIATIIEDSLKSPFGILDWIVTKVGRENFPSFYEVKKNIDNDLASNPKFTQAIGTDIKASLGSMVTVSGNNSYYYIESLTNEYENKINDFLVAFKKDLSQLSKSKRIVIIYRIPGGFDRIKNDPQEWFISFVKEIAQIDLQVIILCEKNAGNLSHIFPYKYSIMFEDLDVKDIIPAANEHFESPEAESFCHAIVDEKDKIDYTLFKFKLDRQINRN